MKGDGYELRVCRGGACPMAAVETEGLVSRLKGLLEEARLGDFFRSLPLKSQKRYRFRVAVAACPNACPQVQIADFGLIGQVVPRLSGDCVGCGVCEEVCEEEAVSVEDKWPLFDAERCLNCGLCIRACPKKALEPEVKGFKVLVGGKLGRHPQLAREIVALASEEEVLRLLDRVLSYYQAHCRRGERLGTLINQTGWDEFLAHVLNRERH